MLEQGWVDPLTWGAGARAGADGLFWCFGDPLHRRKKYDGRTCGKHDFMSKQCNLSLKHLFTLLK